MSSDASRPGIQPAELAHVDQWDEPSAAGPYRVKPAIIVSWPCIRDPCLMRRRTYYCMQLSILLTESMSLIRSIRGRYTSVLRELCKPQEDSGRLSTGTIFSRRDYDQAVSAVRTSYYKTGRDQTPFCWVYFRFLDLPSGIDTRAACLDKTRTEYCCCLLACLSERRTQTL